MSIISERPISVTSAKNNVAISPGETPKNWLDEGLLENVSEQTTSICDFFEQHVETSHMEPQVSEESGEDDKVEASSDELTDFSDIEYNLDSEDLFCDDGDIEKVKKHVEHSLRDLGILGAETMNRDESEFSAESDELLTASESSDDDQCTPQNKYPYFNEKTGFCKVGHNRTRCKDEPTDPKKAADGAKDAARKKVSRQLKKARLEGPQQVKSNPSPPKKPKDRRKCKDPQPSRMRENQVSNQVPPVSEWTMGYETSTSVVTYRPPRHEGPIYINGGVFTSQKQS